MESIETPQSAARPTILSRLAKGWLYFSAAIGTCGCLVTLVLAFLVVGALSQLGDGWSELTTGADDGNATLVEADARAEGTVAVVPVSGVLLESVTVPVLSDTYEADVRALSDRLESLATDDSVKAIVLDIDSPGGSTYASALLYEKIAGVAEQKPVVAYLNSVAASGGYYVALPAARIIAHPETLTGSIGVIMTTYNLSALGDKVGIDEVVIKSGVHKDMGSYWRDLSETERGILQDIIDESYERFVGAVDANREVDADNREALLDGRILTSAQALAGGLINEIGTPESAVAAAAGLAGVEHYDVYRYESDDFWSVLFSELRGGELSVAGVPIRDSRAVRSGQLLYLWEQAL